MDVSETKREKELIQSFISDMSHQIKTPLSGVAMYTDLLLEGNVTEAERQEFLSRIKTGTEKLRWLMGSLVKMSRLEVGAIELSPGPRGHQTDHIRKRRGGERGGGRKKHFHPDGPF